MINLISGNLNTFGDAGQFEADRSTWGFSDNFSSYTRSSTYKSAGNFGCRAETVNPFNIFGNPIVPCRFIGVAGKKYIIRAKVRAFASENPGPDANIITLKNDLSDALKFNIISNINTTIGDIKASEQDIELRLSAIETKVFTGFSVSFSGGDAVTVGGAIYVDQLEVYEYEDVVLVCNLTIDVPGSTVTNETAAAANDGSVAVATTGSAGAVEFRIDGGTYQPSGLFTGLSPGVHIVEVRELAETDCIASYPFIVLAFGATPLTVVADHTNETVIGLSDGTITITASNGTTPYQFSIDGGANYQSTNTFSGLAPGNYSVVVLDNVSNLGSANVIIEPGITAFGGIDFSKNYITKRLTATSNSSEKYYRIYNRVLVERFTGTGVFLETLSLELEPETDGSATFYLQQAFKGLFALNTPASNTSDIVKLTDRSLLYKSSYGDVFDDKIVPDSFTESNPSLVIFGGISKAKYPDMRYFTNYLRDKKQFMTWLPTVQEVDKSQEQYLQYFVYDPEQTQAVLRCLVYFDDNTTEETTLTTYTGTEYADILLIPAGPIHSGVAAVDVLKVITRYELWIEDQSGNEMTVHMIFNLTEFTLPFTRYFMYLNSVGAHEVLRTTGKATTQFQVAKRNMQKFLPHDNSALDQEIETLNPSLQNTYEYSTGYFKGTQAKEYLKSLTDLLISQTVYELVDGKRIPKLVQADSIELEDEDYNYFLRFTCIDPYNEEVYTPDTA